MLYFFHNFVKTIMRAIILSFSICLLLGCRTNNHPVQQTPSAISRALSSELTPAQQEAFQSMVEDARSTRTKVGRPISLMDGIVEAADKEITYLPMYDLDIDKFHSLPTPENLFNSLVPVRDSMYFLVCEGGEILYTLFAVKRKGQWLPGGLVHGRTSGVYRKFGIQPPPPSPVEKLLQDARRTDWRVFRCVFYIYFTYCLEGERFYYSVTDDKNMTSAEACEDIGSFVERLKEDQARGEEYYY